MSRVMVRYAAAWLGAGVVFVILDAVWLTTTNATLYRPALAPILATSVRLVPAVLFYLVYLTGAVVFAVRPALEARDWRRAPALGAMFGFFAYATYDLTNQATLSVWATHITVLDLSWGAFLTAAGSTAGYFAGAIVSRR
jgi:uncharacterized membrane protein